MKTDFTQSNELLLQFNTARMFLAEEEEEEEEEARIVVSLLDITERKRAEAAIQEQAERFRTMMSTISEGFWLVDDKGRLLDVNEAYCRMSAYSKEELLTLSIPDLEAAETQAETAGHIQTIIESGSDLFESRHKTKDGRIFDVEISVAFWPAKRQFFVFIQDITKRKQAEAAIQRRDRILEALAYAGEQLLISAVLEEGLPDMLGHLGKAVEVARVYIFENHSGAAGELLTSQRYEWVNAGFRPQIDNPDLQDFHLASNGFSRWIEIMERGGTIHGNIREFPESECDVLSAQEIQSILVVPIFVGQKWWGFIGFDDCLAEREWFAIEIEALKTAASTLGAAIQRKQAEEALRRNEALLLQTGKMAKVGGWELDLPRMKLLWSLETYRIHEVDPSFQPDLEKAINFYAPEARPVINEAVRRASEEGTPYDLELPFITAKGRHIWVRAIGQTEFRDGKYVRLFGAFQDITERKRMEAAEREQRILAEALRDIAAALNSTLDIDEVLERILDNVGRVVPHDAANIMLIESDSIRVVRCRGYAERGIEEQILALRFSLSDVSNLRQMAETGQPVAIPDTQTFPGWVALPATRWIRSYVSAPICLKGKTIGFLNLDNATPGFFTQSHTEPLKAFADQAASALENARLFAETERRLQHLTGLRAVDMAITSSFDLRLTLGVVLDQVTAQLKVDAADVLLLAPHLQTLEFSAGRGFRGKAIERSRLRLGEGYAGRAALERRTHTLSNLAEVDDFSRATLVADEGFVSYHAVPLTAKGHVKGVLEVFHRAPLAPDPEWLNFLETLAGQAAIAIDNASLFNGLQRANAELNLAYDATIEGWSRAMDLRDKETEGHTQRVTEMTERLARAMGLSEVELVHIRRGALLHDMGKMGVPDHILLKPDKLTEDEWVIMRQHPQYAYEMLSPIVYLQKALDIPYCHHEKWDGSGYPRGLKGEQIPLAARIFAVADVWDALRSDRPYRSGWSEEKVREYILEQSGKHFEPQVVEVFLRLAQSQP